MFESALEKLPKAETLHGTLGQCYLQTNQIDKAIESLKHAVALQDESPNDHYMLGTAFAQKGNGEQAVYHIRKCIEHAPQFKQAYLQMANILDGMGRKGEANQYRAAASKLR